MLRHLRSASAGLLSASIALSTFVMPQPGSAATNAVTDVSYGKRDGAFTVSVAATDAVSTRVQRLSVDAKQNLQDLVVDVSPASYDGLTRVIGFSSGSIRQVRFGQLSSSPAVMRIVVESQGAQPYNLQAGSGSKSLTLSVPTSQVAYTLPTAQAVAAARAADTQSSSSEKAASTVASNAPVHPAKAAPAAKPVAAAPKPQVVAVSKPA